MFMEQDSRSWIVDRGWKIVDGRGRDISAFFVVVGFHAAGEKIDGFGELGEALVQRCEEIVVTQ
jgi:hypothetical protein